MHSEKMSNLESRRSTRFLPPIVIAAFCGWSGLSVAEDAPILPVESRLYPGAQHSLMLDVEQTSRGFVAVGERGHILLSDDGQNWEQVLAPVNSLLTAVSFPSDQQGWAVGHDAAILHTADGGHTWELQYFEPQGAGPLLDVQFQSEQVGFAVGAFGTFLQTKDGGASWSPADAPVVSNAGAHLYSINLFPGGRWLIAGEMGFIATSDDGDEWRAVESPYHGSFYAAAPLAEQGVVLVGMRGNAFVTDNLSDGIWKPFDTGTVLSLTNITATGTGRFIVTTLNRQLLQLDANGTVTPLALPAELTAGGTAGSYNDVLLGADELLIASDQGVLHIPLPPAALARGITD